MAKCQRARLIWPLGVRCDNELSLFPEGKVKFLQHEFRLKSNCYTSQGRCQANQDTNPNRARDSGVAGDLTASTQTKTCQLIHVTSRFRDRKMLSRFAEQTRSKICRAENGARERKTWKATSFLLGLSLSSRGHSRRVPTSRVYGRKKAFIISTWTSIFEAAAARARELKCARSQYVSAVCALEPRG